MIYPPELLDRLESYGREKWTGDPWRHVLGEREPIRFNTLGARWNPPEIPALYASLERTTALAEGDYLLSLQSVRPTVKRRLVKLSVELRKVINLTHDRLAQVGVGSSELQSIDHTACQLVGGAAAWLDCDGILVPSTRAPGTNVVVFALNRDISDALDVVESEIIRAENR